MSLTAFFLNIPDWESYWFTLFTQWNQRQTSHSMGADLPCFRLTALFQRICKTVSWSLVLTKNLMTFLDRFQVGRNAALQQTALVSNPELPAPFDCRLQTQHYSEKTATEKLHKLQSRLTRAAPREEQERSSGEPRGSSWTLPAHLCFHFKAKLAFLDEQSKCYIKSNSNQTCSQWLN